MSHTDIMEDEMALDLYMPVRNMSNQMLSEQLDAIQKIPAFEATWNATVRFDELVREINRRMAVIQ